MFVAATEFCMCVCLRVLRVCVFFFFIFKPKNTNAAQRCRTFFFSSNNVDVRIGMCLSLYHQKSVFFCFSFEKTCRACQVFGGFCAKLFTFTFTFTLEMPVCRLPELRSNFSYFFYYFLCLCSSEQRALLTVSILVLRKSFLRLSLKSKKVIP